MNQHLNDANGHDYAKEPKEALSAGGATGKEPEQKYEYTEDEWANTRDHPKHRWAIINEASPVPSDQYAGYEQPCGPKT